MACPPLGELLQLIRGALAPAARIRIETHIYEGCNPCRKNRQWLSDLMTVTATDDSFEFSEERILWSVAQFKAASGMSPSRPQILARLIFDNFFLRPALEVRSMTA